MVSKAETNEICAGEVCAGEVDVEHEWDVDDDARRLWGTGTDAERWFLSHESILSEEDREQAKKFIDGSTTAAKVGKTAFLIFMEEAGSEQLKMLQDMEDKWNDDEANEDDKKWFANRYDRFDAMVQKGKDDPDYRCSRVQYGGNGKTVTNFMVENRRDTEESVEMALDGTGPGFGTHEVGFFKRAKKEEAGSEQLKMLQDMEKNLNDYEANEQRVWDELKFLY
jgi:hypothetical protein